MKFKKIEISAFRIYDKAENATFDFSLNENVTADFVSIYAPNGYGKTSFYDAVEWGMTNNIQRFWQNKTITSGAIDALKNQFVIRRLIFKVVIQIAQEYASRFDAARYIPYRQCSIGNMVQHTQ